MDEILLSHLPVSEILRYLNCSSDDQKMRILAKSCAEELCKTARPRTLRHTFPIALEDNSVIIGKNALLLPGQDLMHVLKDCKKAVLFCATLGTSVDLLIRREQLCDMTRSVVLDSCASTAIEIVCDQVEKAVQEEYPESYLSARYSPGYGDLPVSVQKDFLALLDAPRKIGLCATDTNILTPRKSVTAVIGLSDQPLKKIKKNCATCLIRERCAFRKKEEHCGLSQTD